MSISEEVFMTEDKEICCPEPCCSDTEDCGGGDCC
jgi:hypothetical protein